MYILESHNIPWVKAQSAERALKVLFFPNNSLHEDLAVRQISFFFFKDIKKGSSKF